MKSKVILTAALLCAFSLVSFAKPLKVFILAGQSNMEGHAEISTFDYIGKDPLTAPLLKEMRNSDGTPRVCDKVWMSYLTGPYDGSANGEGLGKLTAGFGARDDQPTKLCSKIGPEFTFGIYMEKELKEPILIIKTAWGGRSLNTEFRPPSAGPYKLPKEIQDEWDQHPQGAHGVPKLEERKKWQEDKDAASGVFYRMMIDHVKKVLADPKRVCPEYDEKAGFELAGFVWLQGFNDLVDGTTYPNNNYDEYSRLLAHFIRDVRKELSAPKMPFVIGVMGIAGEKADSQMSIFRKAMAAPASMPEFKDNVAAVETAPFWSAELAAIDEKNQKVEEVRGWLDNKDQNGPNADGKMTDGQKNKYMKKFEADLISPAEATMWKRGASNAGYHYLGCAKTFALMGKAFAQANLHMLK
jgi:hypothetical protein